MKPCTKLLFAHVLHTAVGGAKVIFVRTHTAHTYTYTRHKKFADHHSATQTVSARARRNKIDRVRATHLFRDGLAVHLNFPYR